MRISDEVRGQLARRFDVLLPHLNERQKRLALATEARLLGHGGVRLVARTAGVSETTVRKGVFDLAGGHAAGLSAAAGANFPKAAGKTISKAFSVQSSQANDHAERVKEGR
jgi:hypothetical protein